MKSLKKREAELTALQDFASKNRVDDELKLGMRDALWTPGVMSMTKTAELKKLLVERLVDLPLDRRRELIRIRVAVEVDPGQGTERVKFTQLVAPTPTDVP